MAEQFIAQHLAYRQEGLEPPHLFYWLRQNKSANAEVDFVTSIGKTIVPIEVKAGKSGAMKSLLQFVVDKQATRACRFDLNPPSVQNISHKAQKDQQVVEIDYQLVSLPLYLIESLQRVLEV